MAKYSVSYTSGATGYGWKQEFDTLKDFESFVDEMRYEFTAKVSVWDNQLKDFVFYKDALTFTPELDVLHSCLRDFRTKTREIKI